MSNILNIINDKVILLNTGTLVLTFTDIEELLKLVLLIFSILYTILKLVFQVKGDETLNSKIKEYFSKKSDD